MERITIIIKAGWFVKNQDIQWISYYKSFDSQLPSYSHYLLVCFLTIGFEHFSDRQHTDCRQGCAPGMIIRPVQVGMSAKNRQSRGVISVEMCLHDL
jgi:hypothetical protein